jgi:hypothetical protein
MSFWKPGKWREPGCPGCPAEGHYHYPEPGGRIWCCRTGDPPGRRNRILIELPGIDDHARAMEIIGRTAQLNPCGPDGEVILTGTNCKNAYVSRDELGRPAVSLEFDPEGTKKFAAATEKFLRQPIAILLGR